MANNRLHKLVWLVEIIRRKRGISFEDLNRRWIDDEVDGGRPLSKSNLRNWMREIWDTFHVNIENDRSGEYLYRIVNGPDIEHDRIRLWLMQNMALSNTLAECVNMKSRIVLEDIPSGMFHLQNIVTAMKEGLRVSMTYKSYFSAEASTFAAEPYCVKLFKQRWYMVARSLRHGGMRIYALDRIASLRITDEPFDMPGDWSAEQFFDGCYGIIREPLPAEDITLHVSAVQANYMRDLPLHPSQQETVQADGSSIFRFHLRPTDDFIQEILWNADEVEVMAPATLRKKIAGMAGRIYNMYREDEA